MTRSSPAVPTLVLVAAALAAALSLCATLASADDAAAPPPAADPAPEPALPDDPTLLKMRVRELRALLERKGPRAACLACTSKREFVQRIRETADWPPAPTPQPAGTDDAPSMEELRNMFAKGRDSEQMEKLKQNLKAAGIDTSNIFSADSFDSDRFAEQFKKPYPEPAAEDHHPQQPTDEPKPDL